MSAQKAPLGSWTQEILERKRKISALFEGSLICPPNKSMIFFTKSITNNLSFWSDLRLSKQLWALFSCFTLFPGLMSEKEQNNSVNGLCLDFFSPKGPRKKHSKPKAVQQKKYIRNKTNNDFVDRSEVSCPKNTLMTIGTG